MRQSSDRSNLKLNGLPESENSTSPSLIADKQILAKEFLFRTHLSGAHGGKETSLNAKNFAKPQNEIWAAFKMSSKRRHWDVRPKNFKRPNPWALPWFSYWAKLRRNWIIRSFRFGPKTKFLLLFEASCFWKSINSTYKKTQRQNE